MCVFFLLSLLLITSSVSVVFDFNASLSDVVSVSPILLPVGVKKKKKGKRLTDVFCVSSFVFTAHSEFCKCCV